MLSWWCQRGVISPDGLVLKRPESSKLPPNKPILIFLPWTYNNLGTEVVRAEANSL